MQHQTYRAHQQGPDIPQSCLWASQTTCHHNSSYQAGSSQSFASSTILSSELKSSSRFPSFFTSWISSWQGRPQRDSERHHRANLPLVLPRGRLQPFLRKIKPGRPPGGVSNCFFFPDFKAYLPPHGGVSTWGSELVSTPGAPSPFHLDGSLQLGHELVVDAPGQLGLQPVEAVVAAGEPLVAAEPKRGGGDRASTTGARSLPFSPFPLQPHLPAATSFSMKASTTAAKSCPRPRTPGPSSSGPPSPPAAVPSAPPLPASAAAAAILPRPRRHQRACGGRQNRAPPGLTTGTEIWGGG